MGRSDLSELQTLICKIGVCFLFPPRLLGTLSAVMVAKISDVEPETQYFHTKCKLPFSCDLSHRWQLTFTLFSSSLCCCPSSLPRSPAGRGHRIKGRPVQLQVTCLPQQSSFPIIEHLTTLRSSSFVQKQSHQRWGPEAALGEPPGKL